MSTILYRQFYIHLKIVLGSPHPSNVCLYVFENDLTLGLVFMRYNIKKHKICE